MIDKKGDRFVSIITPPPFPRARRRVENLTERMGRTCNRVTCRTNFPMRINIHGQGKQKGTFLGGLMFLGTGGGDASWTLEKCDAKQCKKSKKKKQVACKSFRSSPRCAPSFLLWGQLVYPPLRSAHFWIHLGQKFGLPFGRSEAKQLGQT